MDHASRRGDREEADGGAGLRDDGGEEREGPERAGWSIKQLMKGGFLKEAVVFDSNELTD